MPSHPIRPFYIYSTPYVPGTSLSGSARHTSWCLEKAGIDGGFRYVVLRARAATALQKILYLVVVQFCQKKRFAEFLKPVSNPVEDQVVLCRFTTSYQKNESFGRA